MLQITPLNSWHRANGARMVDFGGWDMPVQYTGVIDEHLATRKAAGLFDVSHMGEIEVRGADALGFIQYLTVNDASKLVNGQIQYSACCYPEGGTVDDVTLYKVSDDHYLFCVNAANTDKDFSWMLQVLESGEFGDVQLNNLSKNYAQIALQGPEADAILAELTKVDLAEIPFYHFQTGLIAGYESIISRTGYTGESGFELYCMPEICQEIWTALIRVGGSKGLKPCGLGARDTLRLEMKYALYGHELSAEITPLEAGLGWITKFDKGDFVGRRALMQQKEEGLPRRLVALRMVESGIPREGYPVFAADRQVGQVTSGTMSPCLKVGIALALVESEFAKVGASLEVGIRQKKVASEIVKPPFVQPNTTV